MVIRTDNRLQDFITALLLNFLVTLLSLILAFSWSPNINFVCVLQ